MYNKKYPRFFSIATVSNTIHKKMLKKTPKGLSNIIKSILNRWPLLCLIGWRWYWVCEITLLLLLYIYSTVLINIECIGDFVSVKSISASKQDIWEEMTKYSVSYFYFIPRVLFIHFHAHSGVAEGQQPIPIFDVLAVLRLKVRKQSFMKQPIFPFCVLKLCRCSRLSSGFLSLVMRNLSENNYKGNVLEGEKQNFAL